MFLPLNHFSNHHLFLLFFFADAFIQSDLQLRSGYTFSLVSVFPENRTHNLVRCWRNALPLSHTGAVSLCFLQWKSHLVWIRREICPDQAPFTSRNNLKHLGEKQWFKVKMTDVSEWCGLLWCFYQLFGLSFWRHPFTAEHPLVNTTFLQISSH